MGALMTRSGFVALAGRPNVGKSTLVNAMVGRKVAIVSDKPQTTRRAIRGIATGPDWQLVIVDLPGMQKPRDLLTERMQEQVERELKEADAVLFMLNGEQEIGPGDRFIAEAIKRTAVPAVTVLNKWADKTLDSLLPIGFPTPGNLRARGFAKRLDAIIVDIIARRRQGEAPRLMGSRRRSTSGDSGCCRHCRAVDG